MVLRDSYSFPDGVLMFSVSIKEAEHSDQDPKLGGEKSPYPILIDPAGEMIKTLRNKRRKAHPLFWP